jgi:hypothetical protein
MKGEDPVRNPKPQCVLAIQGENLKLNRSEP